LPGLAASKRQPGFPLSSFHRQQPFSLVPARTKATAAGYFAADEPGVPAGGRFARPVVNGSVCLAACLRPLPSAKAYLCAVAGDRCRPAKAYLCAIAGDRCRPAKA
jgi:hypothetical protein